MMTKYGLDVSQEVIDRQIRKIVNQVYKLLPMRQEGRDWKKPLQTSIEELSGMKRLFPKEDDLFFLILCKMEGLFSLNRDDDMPLYRRVIFECLGLLNILDQNVDK